MDKIGTSGQRPSNCGNHYPGSPGHCPPRCGDQRERQSKWGSSMLGRVSAALLAVALVAPPATAEQAVPNPPWPARCPLAVGLLIDQSGSMSGRFGEVRQATRNVVDALRDKPSKVTIIGFGTVARTVRSDVDVSDDDSRRQLKDDVDLLEVGEGTGSATNWEAALAAAAAHDLDLVVLVTDGVPTAYGDPAQDGPDTPLAAAVATADRLKSAGTRVVAVGIDLATGADGNLAAVTGPQAEQDYFIGEQSSLLRRLYDIMASACGVPFDALAKPEPAVFPWRNALLAALAVVVAIGLLAFLLYRRRRVPVRVDEPVRPTKADAPSAIDHAHLAQRLRDSGKGVDAPHSGGGTGRSSEPGEGGDDPTPPARRSMPLDFLDRKPPTKKDNNP
ncbi:VWA domain-containing protein [Saccharothrix sp. 6-C]|uniref:vWA domain-containing protein n=1 Tax=Saccharothrix sp. 6-C TaxID=2781735 RepID=UPI00191771BD|nr:vWA domain-containing protein [Saccharothrix sp. 6-C]QQQ78184.1 VWA domain-containing protein [Saccharothrix sp. 6-C]